jgi:hypothetical protein
MRHISKERSRGYLYAHFIINNSFKKSCLLQDYVKKYGKFGYAKIDYEILPMRLAFRIIGATNAHTNSLIIYFTG